MSPLSDFCSLKDALTLGSDTQKLSALREMRENLSDGEPSWFFDIAKEHISSKNNDIRWQSIIVIGEYIPTGQRNEEIWNLILQYCGYDDDMQVALATVLLEHLLEYDFERTFDKIRSALQNGVAPVIDLLNRCSAFGQAEGNWYRIQQIIDE